jgi:hypothetical protein
LESYDRGPPPRALAAARLLELNGCLYIDKAEALASLGGSLRRGEVELGRLGDVPTLRAVLSQQIFNINMVMFSKRAGAPGLCFPVLPAMLGNAVMLLIIGVRPNSSGTLILAPFIVGMFLGLAGIFYYAWCQEAALAAMRDHLEFYSNPQCFAQLGLRARLECVRRLGGNGKSYEYFSYFCLDLSQPAAQATRTTTVNVLRTARANGRGRRSSRRSGSAPSATTSLPTRSFTSQTAGTTSASPA